MEQMKLWKQLEEWKSECFWVDLSHEVSTETPHWVGWDPLTVIEKANLNESLFAAHVYTTVGQYGTHVDAPNHMVKGGRSLDQIAIDEMVMPMCIIDLEEACAANPDYVMKVEDILAWEKVYGRIPEGALVIFKSGWGKKNKTEMDNLDEQGARHYPGWGKESVEFLVEERNVASIGHETSDTDAPLFAEKTNYEVEYCILAKDRIQFEFLKNVELCPAVGAVAFCTFPKVKDGTGFPARVFALCPRV